MKPTRIALVAFTAAFLSCSDQVAPAKVVEMTGNNFMKFSVTHFEVKAGQTVMVRLTNAGDLPKETMAHNWLLLTKEADALRFAESGLRYRETDYIPSEQSSYVLAKTRMLGPGESDSVTFRAPREPGRYEYICTFPEHYAGGMRGVMTVRP